MTHAAARHRALDRRYANALARNGETDSHQALLPSRLRTTDMRTMTAPRVPLTTLCPTRDLYMSQPDARDGPPAPRQGSPARNAPHARGNGYASPGGLPERSYAAPAQPQTEGRSDG